MAIPTKEEIHRFVDALPELSEWEDLRRAISERIVIERGLEDIKAGRFVTSEQLRNEFNLPR